MRIWITELAEPLPIDRGSRLWRVGMLAEILARDGHDVTWWTSAFDHFTKTHRSVPGDTVVMAPNYRIRLLMGPGYRRNASLARVRHHRDIARAFSRAIAGAPTPNVIHACLPTLEVSEVAVRYGRDHGVPVLVDVRDLWPDIFTSAVPTVLRPLARVALEPQFRRVRRVLSGAAAITAVSEAYLAWALRKAGRPRGEGDGVVPHGYRRATLTPSQRDAGQLLLRAAGVHDSATICCFVGTFGLTYDLAPVIETARAFQAEGRRNVQFVLAGSGERDAEWRALAAGLPNVVFTGWLPANGVAVLLEQSAVALAAYARGAPQGLPNKVVEYLSSGLPIISSLRGETEDLLATVACGSHYDAGSAGSLGHALRRVLDDDAGRHAMSRRAAERFRAAFEADQVYRGLARRLMTLAAHPAPAPSP
jgi:glycosyltransferase involved in cell wall biosynthesis